MPGEMVKTDRNQRILSELDQLGYLFPEYELCREDRKPVRIGSGTFSTVYEMTGKKWTGSHYACKVIGFEREIAPSERFWEIVHMQQKLYARSANIVRILEAKELLVFADAEGNLIRVAPYTAASGNDSLRLQIILMEKLSDIIQPGAGMQAVLLREELSDEKHVLDFAVQIGDALLEAHAAGVMHRDVKLENIFWDPSERRYKLGDFGIARYVETGVASTFAHTFGYSAPEAQNGAQNAYDKTVDIYSLGITLYLLLNDLKFPGSDYYRVNLVQYHPEFSFPAPAHASETMAHVILKMCRYDSRSRYQSMEEVLEALYRVLSGARVKIKTGHAGEPQRKKPEEKKEVGDETETFRQAKSKEKPWRGPEPEDETETFCQAEPKEKPWRGPEPEDETETFCQAKPKEKPWRGPEPEDETETFCQARSKEKPWRGPEPEDETETFCQAKSKEKPWRGPEPEDETETFCQARSKEKPWRGPESADETETFCQPEGRSEKKPETGHQRKTGENTQNTQYGESTTEWTNTSTEFQGYSDTQTTEPATHEPGSYLSRAERRREERINRQRWKEANVRSFIFLTMCLVPFLCGMQGYSEEWLRAEYMILPMLLLMEAILLSIREFYLLVGAAAAIVFGYSVWTTGVTVVHTVLLIAALSATPAVMAAGAVATGLWMYLMIAGTGGPVRYLQNHDVSWVFLILTLLALYGVLSARIRTGQIERKRGLRRISFCLSGLYTAAVVGVLLTVLDEFIGITVPEVLNRLHLVRTGFLTATLIYLLAQSSGYAEEMDRAMDESMEQLEKDSAALDEEMAEMKRKWSENEAEMKQK